MAKDKLTTREVWIKTANKMLLGKKIVKVEYMTAKESNDYMWNNRPITFLLDDGTRVIAQMDDEGNDGGVLWFGNKNEESLMPVLHVEDK